MRVIEEPYKDCIREKSISLSLDKEDPYVISDLITLLETAKEKFGDLTVLIQGNSNAYGFSKLVYTSEYDERKEFGEDCHDEPFIGILEGTI